MEEEVSAKKNTFWTERGQPWRTEPEIPAERQAELAARRAIAPDVKRGIYPFKDVRLGRADIEWLLATHQDGRGPVDPNDESQRRRAGLDLRGADLRQARLRGLPLARTCSDPTWPSLMDLTEKHRRMVAIQLQGADLTDASLAGSHLDYSDMRGATLRGCDLEGSSLWAVDLRAADCDGVHLDGSDLWNARLDGAFLYRASLQGTRLHEVDWAGVHLNDPRLADENGVGPRVADINWTGVNLSVIDWSQVRVLGDDYWAAQEDGDEGGMDRSRRIQLLKSAVRANQQLALALQAQGMTDDANRFFYRSRVLGRKLLGLHGGRRVGLYGISLLLDILTGYGYRMGRIIVAYLVLLFCFAALYYTFGQAGAPHISIREAAVLSITAFHGRVFATPFRVNSPQSVVTAVEAFTGFLFEGLFIAMLVQRVFGR
jgi:uncharacterized protein YjbI with pentapeptide repeats